MMILIAIFSFILYTYAIGCTFREIANSESNNLLKEKHKNAHLSILLANLGTSLTLLYWLFSRKGFDYVVEVSLIQQNLWIVIVSMSILSTSITRHFRKERRNEDLALNLKKEVKRTVNFKFSKQKDFEGIVDEFIRESKQEVTYITSTDKNIEEYKTLKKGEKRSFTECTYLEKNTDKVEHNYIYHNLKPIVFGLHLHLNSDETIEPLVYNLKLYIKKADKLKLVNIKVGEKYNIPKNVEHGVIFSKANKINVKWS